MRPRGLVRRGIHRVCGRRPAPTLTPPSVWTAPTTETTASPARGYGITPAGEIPLGSEMFCHSGQQHVPLRVAGRRRFLREQRRPFFGRSPPVLREELPGVLPPDLLIMLAREVASEAGQSHWLVGHGHPSVRRLRPAIPASCTPRGDCRVHGGGCESPCGSVPKPERRRSPGRRGAVVRLTWPGTGPGVSCRH